ncbi:MAG TPA: lysylphosphatidylglycerol synthase domain-containing protein, partial [Actinomycetota bacterium]|nr:lysylphosphatidylglycerol synthase domain-containing protein [Actinomycetota bacterium]
MIFTRLAKLLKFRIPMWLAWTAGLSFTAVAVWFMRSSFDLAALGASFEAARSSPVALLAILAVYFAAFALRAQVWRSVVPKLSFGHALAAIHLAIAGNHLLPLRLGEALRVTSVVKRTRLSLSEATASSITLRAADALALAGLLLVLGPGLALPRLAGAFGVLTLTLLALMGGGMVWMKRLRRTAEGLAAPGAFVAAGSVAAWLLESVVIWQAAHWAGIPISAADAVLVTAATIFSQVIAVAPGGFGTYEAAATGMLVVLGAAPGPALAAALTAHALKTAYSLVAGGVAVFVPWPGLFGRLRLASQPPRPLEGFPPPAPGAPIFFFLPARNEEANVAGVIARMPAQVDGHPVECVVIDDGSTDRTAEVAVRAGARVVSLTGSHGLGAGVRRGLAEGVARGAAAVVFCDADGEYDPAELERLVEPILSGRADYVAGSRFSTGSRRMKPHRMVGNRLLSLALTLLARRR